LPIMDFIFIDGGHSTETIQSDWENLQKVISKDTVILFDDYYEKIDTKNIGCNTVIKKIQDSSKYSIELLDPVDHLRENNLFIRIVKVNKLN